MCTICSRFRSTSGQKRCSRSAYASACCARRCRYKGRVRAAARHPGGDRAPDIPWRQIVGMRNILVHHYFAIDRDTAWAAIEQNLPELKRAVDTLLVQFDAQP
ncbi:MAG TPA: DUF86 domain-containing protein [Roseiflexaceae bacterium]